MKHPQTDLKSAGTVKAPPSAVKPLGPTPPLDPVPARAKPAPAKPSKKTSTR